MKLFHKTTCASACMLLSFLGVSAQTVFSTDFTSDTMTYDPAIDGGLLYKGDFAETTWGAVGVAAATITDFQSSGNFVLTLKGNNDGNNRSAAMYLNAATINGATSSNNFQLNFDIIDIQNAAGSTLYVSVFEAKFGSSGGYYMDTVTPGGTNGTVGNFPASDAVWAQLGSTVIFTDLDTSSPGSVSSLLNQSVSFTRTDSTYDIVTFFGFDKDVTFDNWAFVDNVSITVVPEPSVFALMAGALALGLVVRRRLR